MTAAAIIFLTSASTGCSTEPLVCTQQGCLNGLLLIVPAAPLSGYRLEVMPMGSVEERFVYECGASQPCDGSAFFPDFLPERARVFLIVGTDTTMRDISARYEAKYPNGKRCGGPCLYAEVTVPE